jgi:phage-related protein
MMPVPLEQIPSYSSSVGVKPRIKLVRFGDGYNQRGADGINLFPQVWNLTFNNRSDTEIEALIETLKSAAGGSISWQPPGEAAPLNFMCLEWNRSFQGFNNTTVTCQLEQVFEP